MGAAGTGKPFWEQVEKTPSCWLWVGATSPKGYGVAYDAVTQGVCSAHRMSYEELVGAIAEGMVLDHLCRNRACVNPDHLEPVTNRENLLRSPLTLAAQNAAKTHCVRAHEFTPENTYTHPQRGTRQCRTCRRQRDARRKAA